MSKGPHCNKKITNNRHLHVRFERLWAEHRHRPLPHHPRHTQSEHSQALSHPWWGKREPETLWALVLADTGLVTIFCVLAELVIPDLAILFWLFWTFLIFHWSCKCVDSSTRKRAIGLCRQMEFFSTLAVSNHCVEKCRDQLVAAHPEWATCKTQHEKFLQDQHKCRVSRLRGWTVSVHVARKKPICWVLGWIIREFKILATNTCDQVSSVSRKDAV